MAPNKRKNLLARCMRAIGYVTNPATAPGKVFALLEKKATAMMNRVARHDLTLDAVGKAMQQSFLFRARSHQAMDAALARMRVATVADVATLHEELRRLGDRVEEMDARLERLLSLLERMEQRGAL